MTHPAPSPDPTPMPTPLPTPTPFVELCRLLVEEGNGASYRGWLAYDPADPHAAKLTIETSTGYIDWFFDRDLLRRGLKRPTGDGDIRIAPLGDAHVMIRLSGDEGDCYMSLARSIVARWVWRSYAMVPDGAEPFDVDGLYKWLDSEPEVAS